MSAISNLGYIWYYGRTDKKDYEKAFYYFTKAAELGDITAAHKIADMYKNGYYVEKDYDKYKRIIEKLYHDVCIKRHIQAPVSEVFTRMAKIRVEEGNKDAPLALYIYARNFLMQRIEYDPFFAT